jgi:uncharacterized protein (DUF488 family)
MSKFYTIGHSNHPIEYFISLLTKYDIKRVIDVRSSHYSKFVNQFNKNNLKRTLEDEGVEYVFEGKYLGARQSNRKLFTDGILDFEKVREYKTFKNSMNNIINDNKTNTTVFMCSEKDPIDCHRFWLVAKDLADKKIITKHILADGTIETHNEIEQSLLNNISNNNSSNNQTLDNWFGSNNNTNLDDVYKKHNKRIGYKHYNYNL